MKGTNIIFICAILIFYGINSAKAITYEHNNENEESPREKRICKYFSCIIHRVSRQTG